MLRQGNLSGVGVESRFNWCAELGDRLRSVNEVLRVVEEFSGVAMDIQEEIPADDPLLRPWQLPYPAAAMPIGGAHMLQY
jgi:hypothetical protein